MKVGSKRITAAVAGAVVVFLISAVVTASGSRSVTPSAASAIGHAKAARPAVLPASIRTLAAASSQAAPARGAAQGPQPQLVETVFKNIQVLKGTTVDDFMGTMGIMSAALGFCCSNCHTGAGTDTVKWEEDTPRKRTARRMVTMVQNINKENFGGRQVVTCWTCHRGRYFPVTTPELDTVYGEPKMEPDDILMPAPGVPSVDQILTKFTQAIGGAQKLATITSYTAKAKAIGFGGFGGDAQVEIYAKAPDQRAVHIHFPEDPTRGDSTRTFNGRTGWLATPLAVLRKYELTGGELDGARFDAQLSFPWQIKQVLTNLRAVAPAVIDGKDYDVIQGNGPRGLVGTLYFDAKTGLLGRVVRFTPSPIGRIPTQIDYSDYRDVNGIKFPFRSQFAWLDGRDRFEMTEIQFNTPIESSRFDEPNPLGGK
jgi:photosynthetic reaction center cytochrome c subunit